MNRSKGQFSLRIGGVEIQFKNATEMRQAVERLNAALADAQHRDSGATPPSV